MILILSTLILPNSSPLLRCYQVKLENWQKNSVSIMIRSSTNNTINAWLTCMEERWQMTRNVSSLKLSNSTMFSMSYISAKIRLKWLKNCLMLSRCKVEIGQSSYMIPIELYKQMESTVICYVYLRQKEISKVFLVWLERANSIVVKIFSLKVFSLESKSFQNIYTIWWQATCTTMNFSTKLSMIYNHLCKFL